MQEEGLALGDTCHPQLCAHLATGSISFLQIKFQVTQPEVKKPPTLHWAARLESGD